MNELTTRFDLTKINNTAADMPPTYHFLSDKTRLLCLDTLTRWPSKRWAWLSDGEDLTDEEWDEVESIIDQAVMELITSMLTGSILPYAGDDVPDGFLLCDGSEVGREEYDDLFDVIGETFGNGDGSTTFNLPDLSGRVPVGQDSGQSEFDTLGKTGGEKAHTLSELEMPSHTHTEITATAVVINGGLEAPAASAIPGVSITGSTGGGEAHNNLQPYLVLSYIIKT